VLPERDPAEIPTEKAVRVARGGEVVESEKIGVD